MKNRVSSRYRSLLARGGAVCAISILLFCGIGCHDSKDTDTNVIQPVTTEVSTTCTTATTVSNSTTTSTTTSATTTTSMVETVLMTQPVTENQTIAVVTEIEPVYSAYPVTEAERIALVNCVAHEYGSNWVSVYDKACVCACVVNRVNSSQFPNDVLSVLTQPYQFSGAESYAWLGCYSYQVTDSCIEAVDYYFAHPEEFGSYLYFEGDGTRNYFH